ncbi:hypothetical protein [Treponema sp. R6D11]
MKKTILILTVVFIMTLVAGCASSGGGSSKAAAADDGPPPYSLNLSGVTYEIFNQKAKTLTDPGKGVKSATPLKAQYDGVLFLLPPFDTDVTKYKRITVTAKFFDAKGGEMNQKGGGAMIVIVYDPKGDLEGPEMGAGKNTPLKEFNFGGMSMVHTQNGSRITLTQAPGAILLQCTNPLVKFFELTEVTLHNGRD